MDKSLLFTTNDEYITSYLSDREVASVWLAMGDERAAYSLSSCKAWQDDIASGDTLMVTVRDDAGLCFTAWIHHQFSLPGGQLGWVGGWMHPTRRGTRLRGYWHEVRQAFVEQGITVFCAAAARTNRRSIIALRILMGFTISAGFVEGMVIGGEAVCARVFVEHPRYAKLALTLATERTHA